MKLDKKTKDIARDLGLSESDAIMMEFKSNLYIQAALGIQDSDDSHEEIAKKVGTSRARITRISNMGENSVSIDLLIKILVVLENKLPFKMAA